MLESPLSPATKNETGTVTGQPPSMHRPPSAIAARAATVLTCILVLAGSPQAQSGPQPPGAAEEATGAVLEMEALLERLADRADLYREYALGFNCTESVIRSFYNSEKGAFRRRDREVYDYIFTENEKSGQLEEDRRLIEENGRQVRPSSRELLLGIPPSYAWSQIFSRKNRGRFLFRPAGKVLRSYRLLIEMEFVGSAAEPGGADIGGWTGRVTVDSSTLNIHSIVAEPSGQMARVEAETMKYQRAFAIMGVPLASKPRTQSLEVTFGLENQGLTYPTEASMEKSVYVRTGEQGREERTVLRYRDYRFFKVGTQEQEARDASGAEETPPPPPQP